MKIHLRHILSATFTLLHLWQPHAIAEMTLEDKVGQLLMVHFHGEEANAEAKALIQDLGIGSIIYYNWSNGLTSPIQVYKLSQGLQRLAKETPNHIPLLIAIDQEGGVVSRLTQGFTIFPGNKALAMTNTPDLAEKCAFAMGQELKAVGINLNLAPVVDINNNPKNPIIGARSFGETPEVVCLYSSKAVKGFQRANIATSIKHFPGHGDVETDSHQDLPIINKTKKDLAKVELVPFTFLAPQADTIMTAHILLPLIDPKNCATLSPAIMNILRKDIGYNGVVITDSLVMEGILKNSSSLEEAAIRALNAGCDILMLGGKCLIGTSKGYEIEFKDVKRVHQALIDAIKTGRISQQRLDQAVQRIMDLKARYASNTSEEKNIKALVKTQEHQLLAYQIAEKATPNILNISPSVAEEIGNRIWKNECGEKFECLTSWNQGEDFASLGIGHFIWYPTKQSGPFQETFPELLVFLKKEGATPPSWLNINEPCPWKSREVFYQQLKSPEMVSLRQFLFDSKNLQAVFIAKKIDKALPQMLEGLSIEDKTKITTVFNRMASDSRGLYALIDYLNFKGLGVSSKETYQGQGWGLKQVLLKTSPTTKNVVNEFAEAAKAILTQRVKNSPPERNEERWLKGWLNRINTYYTENHSRFSV